MIAFLANLIPIRIFCGYGTFPKENQGEFLLGLKMNSMTLALLDKGFHASVEFMG